MATPTPDSYTFTPGTTLYAGLPTPVPNEMRLSSVSGTLTDYPYQFGRPFKPGVISNFPQVLINGTPVTTQADVKTRHADGSVKFAVLSIVVPSLPTTETVLTFQNQASVISTPETIANMLANYDFEATINVAVSGTPVAGAPVSARTMLTALSDASLAAETAAGGVNSRYWTQGPICTTVLLHDHTTKTYDIGTNATKAIRPMFIVQFWPTIGKYHVRHILEAGDVTKLKDETGLTVTFTTGQASPATRLTQSGVYVYAAMFQSRAYWGGTDVPRCNANHSIAYLSDTGVMPNHDPSIVLNAAGVASYGTDWAGRSKALGESGYWTKFMPNTGGRQDIGLVTKWDIVALYSGAAHMHEIVESNCELAGSWNFFFREGSATKTTFGSVPGRGRIVSKLSRPTQFLYDGNVYMNFSTFAEDLFVIDGTLAVSPAAWTNDSAHTPGLFWTSYLTTGSFFWLEKLQQLAAWNQFIPNPGSGGYDGSANGPTKTDLVLNGVQQRGWGWQIRNRARAWWASVDGSPERDLFDRAMTDAIAQQAGLYDIPGLLVGNRIRDEWNANYLSVLGSSGVTPRPNALSFWSARGNYSRADVGNVGSTGQVPDDYTSGTGAEAPWQRNFMAMCSYHAAELGFAPAKGIADWLAKTTVGTANSSKPRTLSDYVIPTLKAGDAYYQTLEDIWDGWANVGTLNIPGTSGFLPSGPPNSYAATLDSYEAYAATTIAMAKGLPGQETAWAFVEPYHQNTGYYVYDPRYAIIPRV